ncbi:MAG: galactose-1-phosphate uridylyltransferase [Bryobacter sp.]
MPELRRDPITGRWVIISVERARRPSDFIRVPVEGPTNRFCPFCAGHEAKTPPEILAFRPQGGQPNDAKWSLRVVPNKFPALRVEGNLDRMGDGIYDRMNGVGAHEVIVETPRHELFLGQCTEKEVEDLFWAFRERSQDLKKDSRMKYIVCFKNHGEMGGATLEHTHSQIIGLPIVPQAVQAELDGSRRYFDFRERCIWCDMVRQETKEGERMVLETDHYVAFAPYAPRFPFETWVMPKQHESHFEDSTPQSIQNLAWVMRTVLRRIDAVLEKPSYNFVIHTAPALDGALEHFHWHIEIIPRLTKMAGFEWCTGFYINPTPPEEAARFLREAGLV